MMVIIILTLLHLPSTLPTNVPFKGRIQKRKTYYLQIIAFGLQRAAVPYRWARGLSGDIDFLFVSILRKPTKASFALTPPDSRYSLARASKRCTCRDVATLAGVG